MRVLRGVLGVLLAVLGLLVTVVGAAAAFWLIGPDDTVYSGEQHLAVQGRSLVTTPNLVDQHGPTLHVRARSLDGKPVFIGVGRNFDVASYVEPDAYTSLVQIKYPIAFSTEEHVGATTPLAAPATLDWWMAKASGPGQQSLAWPIQDGPYQVVVMPAAGNAPVDVQLEFGIEIPYAFLAALAVLLIGLVLIALAWLTFRRRPRRTATDAVAQESAPDKTPANLRTALSVAAVLTLTAGCGGLPVDNTVTTLSRPAVTADTAHAVLARYDEVVVKAARTRDLKAASAVEADDQLERTQASYQLAGLRKAAVKPPAPFAQATVAAPEYSSYPMRFAALTSGRQLGLWVRPSAGVPWRRSFAATADPAAKMPSITGAREISSDRTAPLADRFAEFLGKSGNSPVVTGNPVDGKAFTLNPGVDALLKMQQARRSQAKIHGATIRSTTDRFAATRPVTLLAPSGESLAFFTLTEKLIVATDGEHVVAWADGDESVLSTREYDDGLNAVYSHSVVMVVPAQGNPRVVAFSTQVLKADGY
ncbi:hypothetical protein ACFVWG_36220 [Kribbella sp. NPDC058245]|uniref:hypothetical protein n=1 Tax=Kribbella sp. NPDC058245 TaxID=3346399 RepID=UPI0036E38475